jgi:hypothetical protein
MVSTSVEIVSEVIQSLLSGLRSHSRIPVKENNKTKQTGKIALFSSLVFI